VVNFHGGGFAIGSSTDDSRWANSCTQAGYTFISVEYRLAPEYPYPVPVEDCVDATKYVLDHMGEFTPPSTSGPEVQGKVVLSGFSAGGSLAVTTALSLLNPSLDSTSMPSSSSSDNAQEGPYQSSILGLIPFYPVLDWYTPRTAKLGPGVVALPGWLTKMFDTSYLPPTVSIPRTHPLISPLLAPDSMLRKLPGVHLCLCSLDSLGREGGVFGDKLGQRDLQGERERERDVCVRWVEGAKHGWDKPPHPLQASVKVEYDAAVASIKRWQSTSG
jgi:acetyl esterase/lipase